MSHRKNLYVSGFIGASISYIFNVLAFTGSFDLLRWSVFSAVFLIVMAGFEKIIELGEKLEN